MRVVWVVRQADGGMIVHLNQLLAGLSNDFEIGIIGPAELRSRIDHDQYTEAVINDGIQPTREVQAIWSLQKTLKKMRPDIVHVHGLKTLLLTVPAARLSGCQRLLFTAHNSLPELPNGWRKFGYRFVQRSLFKRLSSVISVSDAVRQQFLSYIPEHKVVTIHNGILWHQFVGHSRAEARAVAGAAPQDVVIGTVARLIPDKGIGTLLEATSLLKGVIPHLKVVVIGDGPDKGRFLAYRDRLELQEQVVFLGRRDDVPKLMSGWDAFVLPTLAEGFSVSVLEAMAARLPLVVSDIPSMREVLTPAKSGYLVEPEDVPKLAAALLHLLRDMPKARAMGEYNHKRVRELFGTERMVESTRKLYQSLVSQGV